MIEYGHYLNSALPSNQFRCFEMSSFLSSIDSNLFLSTRRKIDRYILSSFQFLFDGGSLYHCVDPGSAVLPHLVRRVPYTVTVHDLIPLLALKGLIPGPVLTRRGTTLLKGVLAAINGASSIVAVSSVTANDLCKYLCIPSKKIIVIENPVFPSNRYKFACRETDDLFSCYENYLNLIHVGTGFYKNRELVLKIADLLNKSGYPVRLTLIGMLNEQEERFLLSSSVSKTTSVFDAVPDAVMSMLMRKAHFLIFPSHYEGFGMPVLEAWKHGCIPISSKQGALADINLEDFTISKYMNAELYVDKIIALWRNSSHRIDALRRGFEHVNSTRFSYVKWTENYKTVLS